MKTTTANPVTSEMSRSRTTFMVKLALMVAIIFVMAFSPLGYLRTPGLTITFLTVPVAVGAIILGPTAGAICGGAFGLTSAIMAQRSFITDQPIWSFIYFISSPYPGGMAVRPDLRCS